MSQTIRWVVRGVNGRVPCDFSWPGVITNRSTVHVTAGEVKPGGTLRLPTPPYQDFYYVLGDADVWISNISPHLNTFRGDDPGGVRFILHVNWDSPLDVAITITVEDALPVEIQGYR
ncbi:MAG: hypothetical protein ACJ8GK_00295 [Luteimonas sp.]